MKVLVTGANGFVGGAVGTTLAAQGHSVRAALRRKSASAHSPTEAITVGTVDAVTDWHSALAGCEAIVHLAARVHVMNDNVADPLTEFRRVNVDGTLNLARQAATAGLRRFVFVSSI